MKGAVFITGASAGFGKACAERFAGDGRPLILAARRKERLVDLQKQLEAKAPVLPLVLDVRDREAVDRAANELPEPFGQVDILVNNAGAALGIGPAHESDPGDWETMIDTNIKGVVNCTRSLLPQMVARNRGHIVNLGSVAGDWPYPGGKCLRCHQGFRETVLPEPSLRSFRDPGAGDQHRAGPVRDRVLHRPVQGG